MKSINSFTQTRVQSRVATASRSVLESSRFLRPAPGQIRIALSALLGFAEAVVSAQSQSATPSKTGASEPSLAELQRQIQSLQAEVERLKEGPPRDSGADDLMARNAGKGKGLTFGFYGEAKYRFPEQGANTFDPHRFVLTPSYALNDWLVFNSEIELEHGAVDESVNGGRNRFDGELELEQFYVDVLINEHFNVRSLGIDLAPIGRINRAHEPTLFFSTERPELYREIIPSTWFEPSVGFFGRIIEGLDYHLMISTGVEDAIPTPGTGATATRPAGFADPGFTAQNGARNARPRVRQASANSLGWSGQLRYRGVQGLDASGSFYVTEVDGIQGESLATLWDIEALYRVPRTGFELRADIAQWNFSDPQYLVANNNATLVDDVGSSMLGWHVELAYHFWPNAWKQGRGAEMDFVPFARYTSIRTQEDLVHGVSAQTNGTTNREFATAGVAYFLNANFVIKADWRHNLDGSTASAASLSSQDYFQLGAGVFF